MAHILYILYFNKIFQGKKKKFYKLFFKFNNLQKYIIRK